MIDKQVQAFAEFQDHSTDKLKGVGAMTAAIVTNYGLLFERFDKGSLIIIFNCQSLQSLEHLWSDYLSGHLDKMAEQYLVTNEMKEKLNMETIRLKTTIEEENYLQCRKVLMERSSVLCSGEYKQKPFWANIILVWEWQVILCMCRNLTLAIEVQVRIFSL